MVNIVNRISNGSRQIRVKLTPSDGNCLPASIVHVLEGYDFGSLEHTEAVQSLRKTCVDHIRRNKEEFHPIVMNEVCELHHLVLEDIPPEIQELMVEEYLGDLLLQGKWCGSEMVVSVIQLYNVNFRIFTEDAPPLNFEAPDGGRFTIDLFFSGEPIKVHYDVVIGVQGEIGWNASTESHTPHLETAPSLRTDPSLSYNPQDLSNEYEPETRSNSLLTAILTCIMEIDPKEWGFQVNLVNLKHLFIREISQDLKGYAEAMQMTPNNLDDLLTHWFVTEEVDIAACSAIANVLQIDIQIQETGSIHVFKGNDNQDNRIIVIEHKNGSYIPKGISGTREIKDAFLTENEPDQGTLSENGPLYGNYELADGNLEEDGDHGGRSTDGETGPLFEANGEENRNSDKVVTAAINVRGCVSRRASTDEGHNSSGADVGSRTDQPAQGEESNYQERVIVSTVNVRGCVNIDKREAMDSELSSSRIDVCGVQETRLAWERIETKHYNWFCSPSSSSTSHRGTGILINKNSGVQLTQFRAISEDMCSARIQKGKICFFVIVVHIPSDGRNSAAFARLTSMVSKIPPEDEFIIIGDFNGHLGADEIKDEFKLLIGRQLLHKACNENGLFMLQLITQFDLVVQNTFARSKSVLQTWSNQNTASQIDHILQPIQSNIRIKEKQVKAEWPKLFKTDHKILTATIRGTSYRKSQQENGKRKNQSTRWDTKLLVSEKNKKKFADCVRRKLGDSAERLQNNPNWKELKGVLAAAANEAIPMKRKPTMSPKTKNAYSKLQKAKYKKWRHPDLVYFGTEVTIARQEFEQTKKESVWRSWRKFFTNIHEVEPQLRLRKTYEFLKQHKRQATRKTGGQNISQFKWLESLLESVTADQTLQLLPEDNYIVPPPSVTEIQNIVEGLRTGTCPGLDGINVELIKHAPWEFYSELERLIGHIWVTNSAPEDVSETMQIPIPKISSPKETTDFRKITLCNVIYKIIASYTLSKLDERMEALPSYQAAFLNNRSVEDHIFTAKRVTEEFWNKGKQMYVFALDLKQAFDSVSQPALVEALKYLRIPNYLINRIIRLGLYEKTCLKWANQRTPMVTKGKGVKQGCPLSPRLFTIVLHHVLCRLKEKFPEIQLEQKRHLKGPLILAYADDLLIICEDLDQLNKICAALKELLADAGLEINQSKSEILIRDPHSTKQPRIEKMQVAEMELNSCASLRYLGVYMTATLNRPETIRQRCLKATRVSKMIVPFLRKNRPPWNLARRIYATVVIPTATFGLNAMSLTSQNRRALRRFERKVIQEWYEACGLKKKSSTRKLLNYRTITKKIKIHRIMYWGHISRRKENHLLQVAYNFKLNGPKRKCRPSDTWQLCLTKDLASFGKSRNDFENLLEDKTKLRKELYKLYEMPEASDSEVSAEEEEETVPNNDDSESDSFTDSDF